MLLRLEEGQRQGEQGCLEVFLAGSVRAKQSERIEAGFQDELANRSVA